MKKIPIIQKLKMKFQRNKGHKFIQIPKSFEPWLVNYIYDP